MSPLKLCRLCRLCFIGVCLVALPLVANAQHEAHSAQVQSLPVVVDGSKTPDLIPDDLAWNHFIAVIAEHKTATPEELRRRLPRIRPIGLSEIDEAALVKTVSGLREELDNIDNIRVSAGNSQSIQERWSSVMISARASVRAALTADGLTRLDDYIRGRVKPAIKIYGK